MLLPVPQKRSKVEPNTTRLESVVNYVKVLQHIGCCVDEEAGYNSIEPIGIFRFTIDFLKMGWTARNDGLDLFSLAKQCL